MSPPRWARRVLLPLVTVVELGLLALFGLVTLIGLLLWPVDSRRRILRIGSMAVAYLGVEIVTLVALWLVWMGRWARPVEWWDRTNLRLTSWALERMMRAGRRCLGFEVVITEPQVNSPLGGVDPVLILARHGGLGDSFALMSMLLNRYERRVRVVLKEVLQWEPLLDVALNRLGACFMPAQASSGESRAERVSGLAADLGPHDALLLFPEGANWTPRRWSRAIRRLRRDRKPEAARAARLMEHVLPPRPGGVFACLDAQPNLSVVIVAHTGLDTLTTVGQAWSAIPFDRAMTVRWWPASPAPQGEQERLHWLTTEWAVVDEWIDATQRISPSDDVPPVYKPSAD